MTFGRSKSGLLVLALAVAVSMTATDGFAQHVASDDDGFRSADDIPNIIGSANTPKESRIDPPVSQSFMERWGAFKKSLDEATGFKFSIAYTQVLQAASSANQWQTGSGAQAEFDFTWELFGRNGAGPKGLIGGKFESRFKVLNATVPQSVAPAAGSIWSGAIGYGEQDPSLSQLWYEQHLIRDRLLIRFGKIAPFAVFDYYKYKSPRVAFLGQPQNFNPTIPFPPSALGLAGGARLTNGGYLAAGVFDANGSPIRPGFDTLFEDGELFSVAEVGWAPDFVFGLEPGKDFRPGNDDYHLTVWHSDVRDRISRPEGWGFTASAQKGFGNVVPYARYGYSNGGATTLKQFASIGAGFENVFGYDADAIGIGLSWGDPWNSALDTQYAFETFYRMQLTPQLALTPDVQVIVDPATDPASDMLGVFSLRGRIAL